jgi:hypothetical protein
MRTTMWTLATLISLVGGPAMALDGDVLSSPSEQSAWARWQGRLALGRGANNLQTSSDTPRVGSASLMGDYYFSSAMFSGVGGFRATSGLIFGPRSALLSTGQPGAGAGSAFSVGSRSLALSATPYGTDPANADNATLPYFGVGYTGLSVRSGWSFSADLGLVGQSASGLRVARSQSLDDAVREMRLAPLVQLGVSYAF